MAETLYDDDIVAWAEEQAAALRRLSRRPELTNAVDWENVIEEIDDLGQNRTASVESLLRQTLVHLIKTLSEPDSPAVGHWRAEGNALQTDARKRFAPSMMRRLDLMEIWSDARRGADVLEARDSMLAPDLPVSCPLGWQELMDRGFDLRSATALVRSRTGKGHGGA